MLFNLGKNKVKMQMHKKSDEDTHKTFNPA